MSYQTIDNLGSWEEIRNCLDLFVGSWIFRGQQRSAWRLEPTIERAVTELPKRAAEGIVYRSFTRSMHAYMSPTDLPTDLLETVALMQHYGAPTRLLDFTRSAYVACFFAVENAIDSNDACAIWAIDKGWCKRNGSMIVRDKLGSLSPELAQFTVVASTVDPLQFEAIFSRNEVRLVLPVEPFRKSARLTIQQGMFLCPGDVDAGFESNLDAYSQDSPEKHVVKIVIPNGLRTEILADLKYMNISRATLFPGLDGFAQSLYHSFLDFEDNHRRISKRRKFGAPFT